MLGEVSAVRRNISEQLAKTADRSAHVPYVALLALWGSTALVSIGYLSSIAHSVKQAVGIPAEFFSNGLLDMDKVYQAVRAGSLTVNQLEQIGRLVDAYGSSQAALQAGRLVSEMSHYEPSVVEKLLIYAPMFALALTLMICMYFAYDYVKARRQHYHIQEAEDDLDQMLDELAEIEKRGKPNSDTSDQDRISRLRDEATGDIHELDPDVDSQLPSLSGSSLV